MSKLARVVVSALLGFGAVAAPVVMTSAPAQAKDVWCC
jgi:hypothetical protein